MGKYDILRRQYSLAAIRPSHSNCPIFRFFVPLDGLGVGRSPNIEV